MNWNGGWHYCFRTSKTDVAQVSYYTCTRPVTVFESDHNRKKGGTLKCLIVVVFFKKKKKKKKKREKAYTHWVQQIKSPKVILKQPYLEYRVSDFVCVIFFLYNSTFESTSNWHFYKLCKNLFNTRGEKNQKHKRAVWDI